MSESESHQEREAREQKPRHTKPQLYACYLEGLKEIARAYGYNLLVHGSMARDLDLIAIPWVDDPKDELYMVTALSEYLGGQVMYQGIAGQKNAAAAPLAGGRTNYVINLNRGGYKRNEAGEIADPIEFTPDPEYYLDISVTPLKTLKP